MQNETFRQLIELAIKFSREACETAQSSPGFAAAVELIAAKTARLELRIKFDPAPSVAAQLVSDADGELVAVLFEHQARLAVAN